MAKMTTKLAEVFGLHKKALVGFTDDMAGIRARIVGAKRELAGLEDIRPPDSEITARIDAYIADTLAFMFETRFVCRPTKFALESSQLDEQYFECWQGLHKRFNA